MRWLNAFFNASVEKKTYLFDDYSRELPQRFINDFIDLQRFVRINFINDLHYFAMCHCLVIVCRWKINKFFNIVHENNWWKWKMNFEHDFDFVLCRRSDVFARLQRWNNYLWYYFFFCFFDSFRDFEELFWKTFWNLHCCSEIVFFILFNNFVFLIADFDVRLSFAKNATFAFQTSDFLNYVNALSKSFRFRSFMKFNLRRELLCCFFQCL